MNTLKLKIKELVENQRILKNQRKTVHIVGERIMEPWMATLKHQSQRHELRLMYAAYGLMRGKTFYQTELSKESIHPLIQYQNDIDKIIKQYTETVCISE